MLGAWGLFIGFVHGFILIPNLTITLYYQSFSAETNPPPIRVAKLTLKPRSPERRAGDRIDHFSAQRTPVQPEGHYPAIQYAPFPFSNKVPNL